MPEKRLRIIEAKGSSAVLVEHYINKIVAQAVMNVAARSSEFTLLFKDDRPKKERENSKT